MELLKRVLANNPRKLHLITKLAEISTDSTRSIFVNRNLRMNLIRWIGFDMDYTLAIYNKRELEDLAFEGTIQKLVSVKGYPAAILNIRYDPDYVIRGLVIDKLRGNLLKIDRFKYVGRATHGMTPIEPETFQQLYSGEKIKHSNGRYVPIDTLFALPEGYLFAQIVEFFEREMPGQAPTDYIQVYDDIKHCIDLVHSDGTLKDQVVKDIGRYIERDPLLPLALDRFREAGKKLFLLTNSGWEYTNAVMTYLFDGALFDEYKTWRDYFHIVIVDASKPGFFLMDSPFYEYDHRSKTATQLDDPTILKKRTIYQKGNFNQLEKMLGHKGDQVLYVGDHIYGDILRSKKDSGWRTALVVQELEDELIKTRGLQNEKTKLTNLEEERLRIEYEVLVFQNKIKKLQEIRLEHLASFSKTELDSIDQEVVRLQQELVNFEVRLHEVTNAIGDLDTHIDTTFHAHWGPVFKERHEISHFGDQVRDYACIYTSRVSNFFFYPTTYTFKSMRDLMPHDRWSDFLSL